MKIHSLKNLLLALCVISISVITSCADKKDDQQPSHCSNGTQDNGETGIDCGGPCNACSNLPVACFTAPDSAVINTSVSFTNCAQQATGYTWNFGDGQSTTLSSPTHSYTATGIYTVTQTVTNAQGTNTTTKSIVVSTMLGNGTNAPVACFTVADTVQKNTSVAFGNCAQYATTYNWNFGDGQSSTLAAPSHTYTTNGAYTVTQTVTNSNGTNTTTKNIVVSTTSGTGTNAPVACFTAPDSTERNTTVAFTNCAQYATTYNWSFGDGQSSTLEAPSHSYTANGTYTVTQTVTNTNGTNTVSHTIVVAGINRSDYVGSYQASDVCTGGTYTYVAQISLSGVNSTDIIIGNIGNFSANASVTATVNGNQFTIPSQTTSGLTFSGSGTLSANLLTITMTYTASDGSQTETCTSTYTKQ